MKNVLYISFFIIFGCNLKKTENKEPVLDVSEEKSIEIHQPKTLFDLIQNKKEIAYNLPKDFEFSKNYTEKELKALDLDPTKIGADEYYFLSKQDFLEKEIEGLSFQIYFRHFYGNQLEKILRVQRTDTVFDIILAGKYSNGSDYSTLSTEFRNDKRFKKSWASIKTVKDEPNIRAYNIDSIWTFYNYDPLLNLTENTVFSSRYYKEIKKNPETGKRDTLFEKIASLGKIHSTEFLYGVSYANYSKNLPETITIYSNNNEARKKLETIETWGAYIDDDIELFSMNKNQFIYFNMSETSGNGYSYFFSVDTRTMTLNKVKQDYGNSILPDSLQLFKGFGIKKDANNKFKSGGTLRSENGRSYYFECEYKMIENNGKFVLKCISTEISPIDY